MTILVVEDDRAVSQLIEAALETNGHACLVARSTAEADLVLETVHVGAMTLDLGLPHGSPLPWLEQVALLRPELARRTLVATGRRLDRTTLSRIEHVGARILLKPFLFSELERSLSAMLEGVESVEPGWTSPSGLGPSEAPHGRRHDREPGE